jgi:glycosyltransferase involved in cell wall biosynthesis
MRVMHFLHEMTLGGGTVHYLQLLKDTVQLGIPCAVATFQDGLMRWDYEKAGVEVFLMPGPEWLEEPARNWKATVLHGHTCGGGSATCEVAKKLGILGGETIHSMVQRTGPMAGDFEVVEVVGLQNMRPGSTLIPWAQDPTRFKVSISRAELRSDYSIPAGAKIIGRNGRLDGSKAPDQFIQVLARMPDVWGIMVGDGAMKADLERLAVILGCRDRLVMPGCRRDQGNWFNAMDVIVYPTHDESVCAGIVEPLFLGKPVVCSPVGCMGETIIHGETGLHAWGVDDLVAKTRWMLDHPKEAAAMGQRGRSHLAAKGQDSPVGEAQAHLDLYQLCEERG